MREWLSEYLILNWGFVVPDLLIITLIIILLWKLVERITKPPIVIIK